MRHLSVRELIGGCLSAWLILEIDVRQLLPVVILHDEAGLRFFDGPGKRREPT
jgi:hypothetical protein